MAKHPMASNRKLDPAPIPLAPAFAQSQDGCQIAIYESGNPAGLELLFLHGFGLDYRVWRKQLQDPQLSAGFRMIAMDLRGHGASSKPPEPAAYEGSRWAGDLDAVLRAKQLVRPTVIAWSFGGRVLNEFLTRHHESRFSAINYVAAATLSHPCFIGPSYGLMAKLGSEAAGEALAAADTIVQMLFDYPPGSAEHTEILQTMTVASPRIRALMRAQPLEYDDMLARLTIPVLASHGEQDTFVMPELAYRLAEAVKAGRASVYPEVGHAVFFGAPGRFNRELRDLAISARR
jgi:non-heme chloroperoxidase